MSLPHNISIAASSKDEDISDETLHLLRRGYKLRTTSMSYGAHSTRRRSRRWRRTKNFFRLFKSMSQGAILSSIPLFLILIVTCLDFITLEYFLDSPDLLFSQRSVAGNEDEFARLRADALQKNVQSLAYLMAILLVIPHMRVICQFFFREGGLLLLIFIILLSSLVSDYSTKVYTNAIHISFGMIAAFLFAYPLRHRQDIIYKALWVVFLSSGMVLFASLLIWLYNFADSLEGYNNGMRYGGLVGNPNNMGWVCMLACWAGFGLATNRSLRRGSRILAFSAVPLSLACATLADSVTTFVVLAMIAAFALGYYFLTSFKPGMQKMLMVWCIFSVIIVIPVCLIYFLPSGSIIATASESLTGDTTLTGRSEIWELGLAAFFERPILGWSFDAHQTVSDSQYSIPFNQYHNGYIDTLVGGGVTLLIVLLWQIANTAARTLRIAGQGIIIFPVISFLAVVFVANISEHAILRIDNPIWQAYVVCAVAIAVIHFTKKKKNVSIPRSKKYSSNARHKKRYRF